MDGVARAHHDDPVASDDEAEPLGDVEGLAQAAAVAGGAGAREVARPPEPEDVTLEAFGRDIPEE